MLFVDEFCGILVYIKFGADVTSQYDYMQRNSGKKKFCRSVSCRPAAGFFIRFSFFAENLLWLLQTIEEQKDLRSRSPGKAPA